MKHKLEALEPLHEKYQFKNPMTQEISHFNSWTEVCEHVLDVATEYVNKEIAEKVTGWICDLSDALIENAVTIESQADN